MKIYSASAGIGEEVAAPAKPKPAKPLRAHRYDDDLFYPDLWQSALLPEEFADLDLLHRKRLQNKNAD